MDKNKIFVGSLPWSINNDSLKRERIAVYAYQLVIERLPRAKAVTDIMINDAIKSNDNLLLAKIYGNSGYGYLLQGNYNAAYPIYLEALEVHQKIDQPALLIRVYQDLMWIQVQLKELEAAEKSINTALDLSRKRNLKLNLTISLNNVPRPITILSILARLEVIMIAEQQEAFYPI